MKPCPRCKLRKPDACFSGRYPNCISCKYHSSKFGGGFKARPRNVKIRTTQASPISASRKALEDVKRCKKERHAFLGRRDVKPKEGSWYLTNYERHLEEELTEEVLPFRFKD